MRSRSLFSVILFALAAGAATASPTAWTVTVGTEAVNGTWQYNKFYPADLTIHPGDQVTFRFVTSDMHNVVFPVAGAHAVPGRIPDPADPKRMVPNPAIEKTADTVYDGKSPVSSGILKGTDDQPSNYTLTFTASGDLVYTCTVHAPVGPDGKVTGMVGWIHVVPQASPLPRTPAQSEALARTQRAADTASAEAADKDAHQVSAKPDGSGHTLWTVSVGATSSTGGEFMGFGSEDLHIQVGDTVEWVQKAIGAPHTVTFKKKGEMMMGPGAFGPSGGPTFDGTAGANSGMMPPLAMGREVKPFRLTFTKAGSFDYVCLPHEMMGMAATVTVGP